MSNVPIARLIKWVRVTRPYSLSYKTGTCQTFLYQIARLIKWVRVTRPYSLSYKTGTCQTFPYQIAKEIKLIITPKGVFRDFFFFFTIPSQRRELSPTRTLKWPGRNRVQITRNTSSAYHVRQAVCHLLRRYSSAVKCDRVEIAFIFSFIFIG